MSGKGKVVKQVIWGKCRVEVIFSTSRFFLGCFLDWANGPSFETATKLGDLGCSRSKSWRAKGSQKDPRKLPRL